MAPRDDHDGLAGTLVHRYADAVCRRDAAAWSATWSPDGTWLLMGQTLEGRDAIVAMWTTAMAGFEHVLQIVHNGSATLDPETGRGAGSWYISEHSRDVGGRNGFLLARYDDEYELLGTTWVFSRRSLAVAYMGPPDLTGTFAAMNDPAL